MALRISQALSMHLPDPPFRLRPYDREMRRRLFQAIGFLDVQAASLDRPSEPMMKGSWLEPLIPANVNDVDVRFDSGEPIASRNDEFTDMTFTLLACKAQYAVRALNFSDFMEPGTKYMHMRQEVVSGFQQAAHQLLRECRPDASDFHWYTKKSVECVTASLQLIALRPLQRNINFTPPKIKEPHSLLKLAVNVLLTARELDIDPRGRPWRWFDCLFIRWHAMAVALAELCVCDDPIIMTLHFPAVEEGYTRFTSKVTDAHQRMLWGPMENIMNRAYAKRNELDSNGSNNIAGGAGSSEVPAVPQTPVEMQWPQQQLRLPPPVSTGQESDPFATALSPSMSLFCPCNPNLWDANDFSCLDDTSWANYESLINDIYGNNEVMFF